MGRLEPSSWDADGRSWQGAQGQGMQPYQMYAGANPYAGQDFQFVQAGMAGMQMNPGFMPAQHAGYQQFSEEAGGGDGGVDDGNAAVGGIADDNGGDGSASGDGAHLQYQQPAQQLQ